MTDLTMPLSGSSTYLLHSQQSLQNAKSSHVVFLTNTIYLYVA